METRQNYVITVGRQFGSGGRELGRRLAETFGIECYDKRLLLEAAKHAGMDVAFFERSDEKFPRFVSGTMAFNMAYNPMPWYTSSSISDESLYHDMATMMMRLVERGPCVIVGRSADYILRSAHVPVVNLFIHAPLDECARRIVARGDAPDMGKARQLAEKTNRLRANFYNFYTDKHWGEAPTYDLCFDSSTLSVDDQVAMVAEYIRRRFGIDPLAGALQ